METKLIWNGIPGLLLLIPALAGAAVLAPDTDSSSGLDVRRDATVVAVDQAMPSVVNIITATLVERRTPYSEMLKRFYGWREMQQGYSVGSGVIIEEDGYFITNFHVLENATRIQV